MKIQGVTIQLHNRTQTGVDAAKRPIYTEIPEDVENVLVGNPSTEEIVDTLNLTGKRAQYWLHIPKGDTHVWEDRKVTLPEPFAGDYKTIGSCTAYIEANTPTAWNKQIMVEKYG